MATKIFAAFVAAMMTMTMSANNTVNYTDANPEPVPGTNVTTVQTNNPKKKVLLITDQSDVQRKYEYNLDDQNRVINRISYVKNNEGDKWIPAAAYMAVYTNDEAVLTYAEYSYRTKTFTNSPKQVRYSKSEYPEVLSLPSALK